MYDNKILLEKWQPTGNWWFNSAKFFESSYVIVIPRHHSFIVHFQYLQKKCTIVLVRWFVSVPKSRGSQVIESSTRTHLKVSSFFFLWKITERSKKNSQIYKKKSFFLRFFITFFAQESAPKSTRGLTHFSCYHLAENSKQKRSFLAHGIFIKKKKNVRKVVF